ncbi:MAG: class I SAM-dependent RNA methyltransferase [Bacilli bacterium]|nr:class I SAM-dependent RNA methyltransferase [Bacilli bacterium]
MKVEVVKLDNFGRGITYINDKICFIENALPEEVVEIEIIEETKKYYLAKVVKYIEKSPLRIEEECPYSSICGACNLNHICFNEENKFKLDKVKGIMEKFASIDPKLVKGIIYHDRNNYRNKITLHGKDNEIGLYKEKTNEIIPINSCLIVNPKINEIIKVLNSLSKKIKEVIIKTSNDNSKVMVKITGNIDNIDLLKELCDVLIINDKYYTDNHVIETNIGNKKYIEGIDSFFQVNNTLTKELYDEVLENVKDKSYSNVLDLYCGTGTIGIYISDYCKKIIGIDYNESNINDANKNKELNNITNIEFINSKVEDKIDTFKDIDLVIVDPPRAGLDTKTKEYLKEINPEKIIYVSCDPITLARDIKDLETYKINYIKVFNMFPRTYHCENIAVLERKN